MKKLKTIQRINKVNISTKVQYLNYKEEYLN